MECRADIHRDGKIMSCQILDLSEQGMRIRTPFPLTVGEELLVEFYVGKSDRLHCTIKVMRMAKSDCGVQIVQISPDDQSCLSKHLDNFLGNNFGRI